jgi:hypothetical protein
MEENNNTWGTDETRRGEVRPVCHLHLKIRQPVSGLDSITVLPLFANASCKKQNKYEKQILSHHASKTMIKV